MELFIDPLLHCNENQTPLLFVFLICQKGILVAFQRAGPASTYRG